MLVSVSATEQPAAVRSSAGRPEDHSDAPLTVTTILAILAIGANRQMLNAENWASTSSGLLENPAIRDATANYLVDHQNAWRRRTARRIRRCGGRTPTATSPASPAV